MSNRPRILVLTVEAEQSRRSHLRPSPPRAGADSWNHTGGGIQFYNQEPRANWCHIKEALLQFGLCCHHTV